MSCPPAKTPLLSLPPELISKVIWSLLRDSLWRDVANTAETCRELNRIATPILWAELCFHVHNHEVFNSCRTQYPKVQVFIRSLTLNMFDEIVCYAASRKRWTSLVKSLKDMPNLKILAVNTVAFGWFGDFASTVAASTLKKQIEQLLLAIPANVSSLSIDVENCWYSSTHNTSCCDQVCTPLRQLMPQLRNLRICQWLCCSKLFSRLDVHAPYLESIVLQTRNYNAGNLRRRVHKYETCSPRIVSLAEEARQVYLAGFFPKIEKFLVTCPHLPVITHNIKVNRYFPAAKRIDIIENTTAVIPFATTKSRHWWARFPEHSHIEGNLYSTQPGSQQFFQCLEGNVWTTRKNGVMVPTPLIQRDKHCFESFPWISIRGHAPTAEPPPDYRSHLVLFVEDNRFPVGYHELYERSDILKVEERVGMKLILPQVTPGLYDADPLLCH